jgi:hypothetical protein
VPVQISNSTTARSYGVDSNIVIGALRFPRNATIGAVEAAAKEPAASGPFSLDSVLVRHVDGRHVWTPPVGKGFFW